MLGSQREPHFQWNMGYSLPNDIRSKCLISVKFSCGSWISSNDAQKNESSLYSTATQTLRFGSSHWVIPLTRDFRVADINMLVSKWPTRGLADPKQGLEEQTRDLVDPMRASGIKFALGTHGSGLRCLSRFFRVG